MEEAVQKLKRGESIGPVTKAAMEGKDSDDEDDGSENKTKDEPDEGKPRKAEEADTKESTEPTDTSTVHETVKPIVVSPEPKASDTDTLVIKVEGEDTSDTHSVSDIPPTPPSTDMSTTTPEPEPEARSSDLVDENIREQLALREITSTTETANRSILSNPDTISDLTPNASTSEKQEAEEPSSEQTEKPTDSKETPESKDEEEERTEIVRIITPLGAKSMEGWEMLEMVLNWVKNEFSADEKALARQLANDEISYRFLWLYYIPGSLISVEESVSKQQVGARVILLPYRPS